MEKLICPTVSNSSRVWSPHSLTHMLMLAKFISRWLILNSQSFREGEGSVCPQDRSPIPESVGVSMVKISNYKCEVIFQIGAFVSERGSRTKIDLKLIN